MNGFTPHLVHDPGEIPRLGDPLVDEYLRFVAARARRNTLLAQAFDLKVFFTIVGKPPTQVDTSPVPRGLTTRAGRSQIRGVPLIIM